MARSIPEHATNIGRRIARSRLRPIARALVPRSGRDRLRTLRKRVYQLVYHGNRVQCPCCERTWRRFQPSWNRPNAICPECNSHERHRGLWLFLDQRHPELLTDPIELLHFAPEECFRRRFEGLPQLRWTTADLDAPEAMEHFDIAAIPHPENRFDAIICSHVLEHVDDDGQAIRELHRVLRPGGWAILMVPMDATAPTTYEDPSIVTPAARKRAFRQEDHVRLYGWDFIDRVRAGGFDVVPDPFLVELEPAIKGRFATSQDPIFVATKPRGA